MNFFLSNGFLLPFLVLALAPLLLHLFAKTKPRIYKFSSNMFLKRSARKSMRMKRPYDILLLILRTLLFLAIIAIFLKPVLSLFPGSGLAGTKTMVLIVDVSASMGVHEGGRTRMAAACAEAADIITSLSSNDKANIVWLQATPTAEYPVAGSNLAGLRDALLRKEITNESGNVDEALKVAFEMLRDIKGRKQICIISDYQASQWEGRNFQAPDDIDIVNIKIGKKFIGNLALSRILASPSEPLPGESVDITCELKNFSPEPRCCTVFFRAGEVRRNRKIMIPANNSSTALFKAVFRKPGIVPLEFFIGSDDFPPDNNINGLLQVRDNIRVAFVKSRKYPAWFWNRALRALPFIKLTVVSPEDGKLDLQPYEVCLVSGWDGRYIEEFREFMQNGNTLICSPAPELDGSKLAALAGITSKAGFSGKIPIETGEKPYFLKLNMPSDPIFKLFASGEYGDPAGGEFLSRLSLNPELNKLGKSLIAFADGVPALIRFKEGAGRLYLWNLPLAPEASHWGSRIQFLPFMAELVLKGKSHTGKHFPVYYPGGKMSLELNSGISAKAVKLFNPEDKPVAVKDSMNGGKPLVRSCPVDVCGLYSWKYHGSRIGYGIVNFPVVESDLRQLPKSKLARFGAMVSGSRELRVLDQGLDLWPMLLAAAVVLLILESLVMFFGRNKIGSKA